MLRKPAAARAPQNAATLSFAIVRSVYHGELTQSMTDACIATLVSAGVPRENIDVYEAPGSWEVPLFAQRALDTKRYDGVAAFGVIVKGETYHFDMIANEVARALMSLSLARKVPVALEVLAVMDIEQARVRAIGKHNKGTEAAGALLSSVAALNG